MGGTVSGEEERRFLAVGENGLGFCAELTADSGCFVGEEVRKIISR